MILCFIFIHIVLKYKKRWKRKDITSCMKTLSWHKIIYNFMLKFFLMLSVQQVHITPEIILTMLIDQVTFSSVVSSTAEIGWSCYAPVYCPDDYFTVSPHVLVHCYRRLPSGVTMRAHTSSCPCGALNIKLNRNCACILQNYNGLILDHSKYDIWCGFWHELFY